MKSYRNETAWDVLNSINGGHRIRHFGLIANNGRKEKLALARELLNVVPAVAVTEANGENAMDEPVRPTFMCAHCGAQMIVLESFVRGQSIRAPPSVTGVS